MKIPVTAERLYDRSALRENAYLRSLTEREERVLHFVYGIQKSHLPAHSHPCMFEQRSTCNPQHLAEEFNH